MTKRRSWVWILLGIVLLAYPIVATLWNDAQLEKSARAYREEVETIEPPAELERLWRQAQDYNASLEHHALPPEETSPGFAEYLDTLNAPETGGKMARISIEAIGVDLPVYHTTRPQVLYHGAGHMFGSDLPVGGEGTNTVITAHTGMVNASMFDHLPLLKEGDLVTLEVLNHTLYYAVTGRTVVAPDRWEAVTYERGIDKLTLITCTPYGINSDRLLVEAHRVPGPQEQTRRAWRLSWWMVADLVAIAVVLVLWIFLERRKR
ncbi:class C sortase [Corynebacterium lizhenjunii]|uniref:class C sortase n=1 Tax=Corynebacterium lizhenjunii TaxID=2709394 RepID=UPI0013EB4FEC|nr:class C sortase [Corynebacterium lizhenjunii]